MAGASPLVQAVTAELAKYPGLDPKAVLAIAGHEGLSGGVGDNGTSFGPFQLHAGGALPHGLANPAQWAWSPQGIDYALNAINKAAGGLHGSQAIQAISTKFERPANPGAEIADAERRYGLPVTSGPASATFPKLGGAGGAPARPQGPSPIVSALKLLGFNAPAGLGRAPAAPQAPAIPPQAPLPAAGAGGIAELLQEGTGGPTHSTGPHVHAAFTNPQLELAAIKEAEALGLHVGENPYVGSMPAPGVHARNSYHYRDFPGSYNGRKLGEAIDVSGGNTQPFYAWLAARKGR